MSSAALTLYGVKIGKRDSWLLGAGILYMIPVVFLMKKAQPGGEIGVH